MKKFKEPLLVIVFFVLFVSPFIFIEIFAFKLLGITYHSIWSLLLFYAIYSFIDIPLGLILDPLLIFLKYKKFIRSTKGLAYLILNFIATSMLIAVIDHFLSSVSIEWYGVVVFSLLFTLFHWFLTRKDPPLPEIGTKEWDDLEKKVNDK